MPGQPRRLRVDTINSTAVRVEWRPPQEGQTNGIIRGYQIHYVRLNEEGDPDSMHLMYDMNIQDQHEVVIGGLHPDSNYQFQVAAYTRKGDGERSRAKRIRTKGAGRSSHSSLNLRPIHLPLSLPFAVPTAPRALELVLEDSDPPLVEATWQVPRSSFGKITGYRLSYGIIGEDTHSRIFDGDVRAFQTPYLGEFSQQHGVEHTEVMTVFSNGLQNVEQSMSSECQLGMRWIMVSKLWLPSGRPMAVSISKSSTHEVRER